MLADGLRNVIARGEGLPLAMVMELDVAMRAIAEYAQKEHLLAAVNKLSSLADRAGTQVIYRKIVGMPTEQQQDWLRTLVETICISDMGERTRQFQELCQELGIDAMAIRLDNGSGNS
jgi:hypothetical protein